MDSTDINFSIEIMAIGKKDDGSPWHIGIQNPLTGLVSDALSIGVYIMGLQEGMK